jgi:2'-5' RNA ligase
MARRGLRRRARSFTPHMTLLYDARSVEARAIEPVAWTVREFVLVHSRWGRTQHILLGHWPLRPIPDRTISPPRRP